LAVSHLTGSLAELLYNEQPGDLATLAASDPIKFSLSVIAISAVRR